jgi:hypothetical protein
MAPITDYFKSFTIPKNRIPRQDEDDEIIVALSSTSRATTRGSATWNQHSEAWAWPATQGHLDFAEQVATGDPTTGRGRVWTLNTNEEIA